MKAVIYARFSSEKQNETSIEGQIRECTDYANFHDIQIVDTYIDRAFSAKTDNRPDFQKMIQDSAKKTFDIVLVWKLDRFSRDRFDSAYYKHILKKNGVRVISAKENISDGPEGIILESMLEGMAEYYSAELSIKVKRGMKENALKCKANGVRPPFGYYVDSDDHFQIDTTLAPIVKEIYEMYLDRIRINDIAKIMNERKINPQGFSVNYNYIFHILTNRKYMGEYKFGETIIPNGMPAIIDDDTFYAVQERMLANKKAPSSHKGEDDYLLTTKLFCGKCGAMMTGSIGTSCTKNKYRYYKCNHVKRHTCDKKTIKKDLLEKLVITEIMEVLSNNDVIEQLAEKVYKLQLQENNTLILMKSRLEEIDGKLDNINQAIANGIYTSSTKQIIHDLEEEKFSIENEICRESVVRPVLTKEQILFALKEYKRLDLTKQKDQQRLIDSFVNSIYLYDDYFIISLNYKNQSKTVTLKDIKSSPIANGGLPRTNTH